MLLHMPIKKEILSSYFLMSECKVAERSCIWGFAMNMLMEELGWSLQNERYSMLANNSTAKDCSRCWTLIYFLMCKRSEAAVVALSFKSAAKQMGQYLGKLNASSHLVGLSLQCLPLDIYHSWGNGPEPLKKFLLKNTRKYFAPSQLPGYFSHWLV